MKVSTIAGRLTKDADLRMTDKGTSYVRFSLAWDAWIKSAKVSQFEDCVMWGQRAETLAPMLVKGQSVTVTGIDECSEYNGERRWTLKVSDLALQGGKPKASASAPVEDIDTGDIPF